MDIRNYLYTVYILYIRNYLLWRTFFETEETNRIQLNLGIQGAECRTETRKLLLILERTLSELYFVTNVTTTTTIKILNCTTADEATNHKYMGKLHNNINEHGGNLPRVTR